MSDEDSVKWLLNKVSRITPPKQVYDRVKSVLKGIPFPKEFYVVVSTDSVDAKSTTIVDIVSTSREETREINTFLERNNKLRDVKSQIYHRYDLIDNPYDLLQTLEHSGIGLYDSKTRTRIWYFSGMYSLVKTDGNDVEFYDIYSPFDFMK